MMVVDDALSWRRVKYFLAFARTLFLREQDKSRVEALVGQLPELQSQLFDERSLTLWRCHWTCRNVSRLFSCTSDSQQTELQHRHDPENLDTRIAT